MIINYRKGVKLLLMSTLLLCGCNNQEGKEISDGGADNHAETQQEAYAKPETPLNALESLVAPIALYPDPLLAEILIAATYPLEIPKAAQRQENVANLSLDASLQRLSQLPQVLMMMDEHPQWVTALGDAFLANPEALLEAIQTLRRRALQSGFLKDSAAQKVLQTAANPEAMMREAIYIQPAETANIQVPLYDPETAFSATLAPPADAANSAVAQPAEPSGADTGFYPAYYPASAEAGDNGVVPQAFSAGVTVNGLVTWGVIVWNADESGYHIKHRYGNLTICNDFADCWLRSEDNGYRYEDELMLTGDKDATIGEKFSGIAWQHDPRHRRGLRYTQETIKRLGDLGLPPLAGQQLNANLPPLPDRGYQAIENTPAPDDTEEEDFAASAPLFKDEGDSVLSGLTAFKAGESVEPARGLETRNKDKTPAPSRGAVRPAVQQRPAILPAVKQDAAWHELQARQQRRDAALTGVFAGLHGNVKFIELFSSRGAQSRSGQLQVQRGVAFGAHAKQAQEASD